MKNREIENTYGADFLRLWTSIIASIGEQYDDHTPEEWAGHAISRLDALGYCIIEKSSSKATNGR